jgi:hypothetical protein
MNEDNFNYLNEYYVSTNNFDTIDNLATTRNLFAYNNNINSKYELGFDYLDIHHQLYDDPYTTGNTVFIIFYYQITLLNNLKLKGSYGYPNIQFPFLNRNTLNWNTLLNKSAPDYVPPSETCGFMNNENINLIRNIENLKRLWQTNNKVDNEEPNNFNNLVETINHQYDTLNTKRTFADVAKTSSQQLKSSSSSSASSSTSSSPPIFNNNHKIVGKKPTIINNKAVLNRRSSTTIVSSGSLESIDDKTLKSGQKDERKVKSKNLKKEIVCLSSDEDRVKEDVFVYTEVNPYKVSLRDIKPDSKYGLDSFDNFQETISLRKRNKNKRKGSFDNNNTNTNNNNNKNVVEFDDNVTSLSKTSSCENVSGGKIKRKPITDVASKLNKKSKNGSLNQQQQQRKGDHPTAKIETQFTNYNDIWDCLSMLKMLIVLSPTCSPCILKPITNFIFLDSGLQVNGNSLFR